MDAQRGSTNPVVSASNGAYSSSGGFPEYTPDLEWNIYQSQVENYFALNGVTDILRQKELFFIHLPNELLDIVIVLIGRQRLVSYTITEILLMLSLHFHDNLTLCYQRMNFCRRERREWETISDYANALRVLAKPCKFGDSLNEQLCTCFLFGLRTHRKLHMLLEESNDVMFDVFVKRATALEAIVEDPSLDDSNSLGKDAASNGASSSSGGFPKYTPNFDWDFYEALVKNYFALNRVQDIRRQKELFLIHLPIEILDIVMVRIGRQHLAAHTITEILQILSGHFHDNLTFCYQRMVFFRRDKREWETISDYANILLVLAKPCKFGDSLNEQLCTCFVFGLRSHLKLFMLLEDCNDILFDVFVKRATALEAILEDPRRVDRNTLGKGSKIALKDQSGQEIRKQTSNAEPRQQNPSSLGLIDIQCLGMPTSFSFN